MTPNTTEKQIQNNTIELFKKMGYNFIPRNEIKNYKNKNEIILKDVLKSQLNKINSFEYKNKLYKFSEKNIENSIKDLDISMNERLNKTNQKITDMITLSNSYTEYLDDGNKQSFNIKYIDFENIENNVFHFTEEFIFEDKRIDLVVFINGIPIGLIELKASNVETDEAIYQMIRNQEENPELFKYSQILVAGNNHSPKYATTLTPIEFWSNWKEDIKLEFENRETSKLDKLIFALFNKTRVLDIIQNYILFDKGIKKIARYQQFFAIKKILENPNQSGVIWHTQGSGKSLTMVMATKLLIKNIIGSKIVVVTDRVGLDSQIHQTFINSELTPKRAKSSRHLIELLQSGTTIVTTVLHKFKMLQQEKITIDDKVFVLVDESHRTQGGDLHRAMKKVFKNGVYIAFTGTPLLKKEKSTYKKFGKEIHRYTIEDAEQDGAVTKLLYENRLADQWINDEKGLDLKFKRITKNLSEKEKADLKRKWTRFQKLASTSRRLELIAFDITEHFKKYLKNTPFKAMLATSSKYEALKYKEIFDEDNELKTAVIISESDERESENENKNFVIKKYKEITKNYKDYENEMKERFKNGDIELLIVVDKLLTGFDAPRAKVLYIDKELKEHNLLQAIARVNRLYEGKDYGLIIDYRGLLENLNNALTSYSSLSGFDEEDIKSAVFDVKSEISKIKTFYSHLEDLFKEVKYKNDMESYEVFLVDEEKRKLFYDYLLSFAKTLELVLSSEESENILSDEEIEHYKEKLKFYIKLKESVKLRYHERVDFSKYESQMRKMMDTFISSNEVIEVLEPVDIFDIKFEEQIDKLNNDNAKADAISSAMSFAISQKFDENPSFYEELSEKIKKILEDYKQNRISKAQKLQELLNLKKQLLENKKEYPKNIDNKLKQALFDNLKEEFYFSDEKMIEFINEVDEIIKKYIKIPDWQETQRDNIELEIEDLLFDIEDEFEVKFDLDKLTPKIMGIIYANTNS